MPYRFDQVPGAGNRITLIDTAAIVAGSLSNKGVNGGVIAGPRSEMTRPFLSLGPGGMFDLFLSILTL